MGAPEMGPDEAEALLGVAGGDPGVLRARFRDLLRRTHPDTNDAADAQVRTRELIAAYRLLRERPPAPFSRRAPTSPTGSTTVRLLDATTIAVDLPREECLDLLVDTGDRLGEILYLDAQGGLLEVLVEFVEAPTSSVVMTMQGRGTGSTEVFCTVEALSGGEPAPADAVTRLLARTMAELVARA